MLIWGNFFKTQYLIKICTKNAPYFQTFFQEAYASEPPWYMRSGVIANKQELEGSK